MRRTPLTTRDPEEDRSALEEAYRRLRLGRPAAAEDSELHLSAVEADPLGVQQSRIVGFHGGGTNDGTNDGTRLIRVGHLAHGRFTVRAGDDEVAGTDAFLFPSRPYTGQWEDPELTTLTVEEVVVTHHARALVGRKDSPRPHRPRTPRRACV